MTYDIVCGKNPDGSGDLTVTVTVHAAAVGTVTALRGSLSSLESGFRAPVRALAGLAGPRPRRPSDGQLSESPAEPGRPAAAAAGITVRPRLRAVGLSTSDCTVPSESLSLRPLAGGWS